MWKTTTSEDWTTHLAPFISTTTCKTPGIIQPVYLSPSVVDQLHGPPPFVLDPDKDASFHIAGGQLLEGFVPSHQDHLQTSRAESHLAGSYQLALHQGKVMLLSRVRRAARPETRLNLRLVSGSETRCCFKSLPYGSKVSCHFVFSLCSI